jgi:hypothetical protein
MTIERFMKGAKAFALQEGVREDVSLGEYSGKVANYADSILDEHLFGESAVRKGLKIGIFAVGIYGALC